MQRELESPPQLHASSFSSSASFAGACAYQFTLTAQRPEQIRDLLVELVVRRIPATLALDPIRDIQVLCPMNRGSIGARELNERLQAALNPLLAGEIEVERFGYRFRLRDKVIQTENNYDKDVFNGDIGQIESMDVIEQEIAIRYDTRLVSYDYGELDEVSLAYAISIHKSQG
ncbi:MAG: hypothetical protein ACJ746_28145 [Bryobacteraceae bacterium]